MSRYSRRRTTEHLHLASLVVIFALGLTDPVKAESSSWFSRSTPPAETKTVVPKSAATSANTPSDKSNADRQAKKRTIPSQVPLTGDDPAYLAFEQGQYLTALKLANDAAARGEPQANTLIGRIYGEGLGVPKDEKAAVEWYTRAADLGDTGGTFALALMLAEGRGTAKNREGAAQLFEKAARTGHAEANYNLGVLFLKGDGKPENPIRAFQHIEYAADKGIAQAQYDLAALYQTGTGVAPNAFEAAKWLSKASAQGLAVAQYDYAVLLLRGFGITQEEPKAVAYMRSAAERGIAGAQNRLAYMHIDGVGVDKSPIEAAKWRLLAKSNGFKDDALDAVIAKLPATERQKGEAAAAIFADRAQVLPLD